MPRGDTPSYTTKGLAAEFDVTPRAIRICKDVGLLASAPPAAPRKKETPP
jgi:hypothetical protein